MSFVENIDMVDVDEYFKSHTFYFMEVCESVCVFVLILYIFEVLLWQALGICTCRF